MKELEKKEREILERLQNTMEEQDRHLQKMEQVMNESKHGFYERKPASPVHHNRQSQSNSNTDFQIKSTQSEKDKPGFRKAVEERKEQKEQKEQKLEKEDKEDKAKENKEKKDKEDKEKMDKEKKDKEQKEKESKELKEKESKEKMDKEKKDKEHKEKESKELKEKENKEKADKEQKLEKENKEEHLPTKSEHEPINLVVESNKSVPKDLETPSSNKDIKEETKHESRD